MHDTDDHTTSEAAQLERIKAEITDSFDEELELQLEEERLDELVADELSAPGRPSLDRQAYFRELFRLQHELVRLQAWIVPKKLNCVCASKGVITSVMGSLMRQAPRPLPFHAGKRGGKRGEQTENDDDAPFELTVAAVRINPEHELDPIGPNQRDHKE